MTKRSVKIENLEKFVNYTVLVQSVSTRGLGVSSIPIYVRTLEEGEFLKVHVHFLLGSNTCFIIIAIVKLQSYLLGGEIGYFI